MSFRLGLFTATILSAALTGVAHGQLRVVEYNTAGVNNTAALETIFEAIAGESTNGLSRPIDALMLQEQNSVSGDTQTILNGLNAHYGAGYYARSTVNGATTGAGTQTLIYNTHTVSLIGQAAVGVTDPNGAARQELRFDIRPVGYDSSADFILYNGHYKASDDTADANRRNVEAQAVRADAALLPSQGITSTDVIYAGDFNIYRSSEPMWGTLTAAGTYAGFDPINRVGSWDNNSSFKDVHTQSPVTTSHFSGQTLGGMDDRFDFQLITSSLNDGKGNAYIPGSYHAFGNNGTHTFNGDISTGTGAAPNVLEALEDASDHLPTVAQYQVPAKMSTSLASVPSQVIVGATLNAQLSVSNTAYDGTVVNSAIGADKLNYGVSASGNSSGSATGQAATAAVPVPNVHTFALSTATAGAKSATFTTTVNASLSPQVPGGPHVNTANYSVLDHATASFDSNSASTSLTLDFGSFYVGSGTHQLAYAVSNLLATAGYTAPLDFLSFNGSGATGTLDAHLSVFDNLAAGASQAYQATFNAAQLGTLSSNYDLTLSDDTSLLGAVGGQHLFLTLTGTGIQFPGDVNLDGTVNGLDISELSSHWLNTDPGDPADLNGDGAVNGLDIAEIAGNWLNSVASGGGTAAVPEPGGILLAASCLALFGTRRTVRALRRSRRDGAVRR